LIPKALVGSVGYTEFQQRLYTRFQRD